MGLDENWKIKGAYLLGCMDGHGLDAGLHRQLAHGVMFKLTRDKPELRHVFPFYWFTNGPQSDTLDELITILQGMKLLYDPSVPGRYDGRYDDYIKEVFR